MLEHETIDGEEVQRLIDLGRVGTPIDSVVTRGVDITRFSQPSPYTGNGEDTAPEPETPTETPAFGGRPISRTPPN